MDTIFSGVFSEYTVTDVAFKYDGASAFVDVDGAGSAQEEYDRKTITKAKSNVVVKKIARSAGTGKLNLSLHMPLELYNILQGYEQGSDAGVLSPVYALAGKTTIPTTEIAMKVEDEDGDVKLKYFPCAASTSFSRSVTSEADQVAEVEMEFDLSVDDYGMLAYEVLADELDALSGTLTSDNWLTSVSSAGLQASA